MTTKNFKLAISITTIALLVMVVPSAFADESFPNWTTHKASPNGWGCDDNCYADSNSNGVNDVYSKSTGLASFHTASVYNNAERAPTVTTDKLELTTSSSLVGMEIDTVYKGSMTTGYGSVATFETGLDLYKEINGAWYKVGGCYATLTANDDLDDSKTLSCTATNAGTNDFRAGATHRAHTQNWNIWVTTIVDFHDSGSGDTDKAETNRLEICHGVC